jgi:hypothetical protein
MKFRHDYARVMRKLIWMIMLIGGYVWLVTSGNEDFVLRQGKMICQLVLDWFDDAEIDFYGSRGQDQSNKKSRRWD